LELGGGFDRTVAEKNIENLTDPIAHNEIEDAIKIEVRGCE
jgi:hypothetical protein